MDYLKYLNTKQYEAVTVDAKRILVLAGAGSGKTRVLTTKIKYLVDKEVQLSNICAFTFTNKAAREMMWRLEKLIGSDKNPFISTFHSFCYSYIVELYYYLGYQKQPIIIDDAGKASVIKDILKENNIDYAVRFFIDSITKIKNLTPLDITTADSLMLNKIYHKYQERLKYLNYIDFDDMIPMYIELAELNNDEVNQRLPEFEYLLIDECQDTNQIQYKLINTLTRENTSVFMVGDDDQLIYSFRNSNIDLFNEFKFKADKVIILNQNYRCTANILEKANTLIKHNTNRENKELFSKIQNDMPIKYYEFNNIEDESRGVAMLIEKLSKKGIELNEMAVLYRNNNQSYSLELELEKRKINYNIYGSSSFLVYSDIKAILAVYKLMINPEDILSLEKIIYEPIPNIEAKDFCLFKEHFKESEKSLFGTLMYYSKNEYLSNLGSKLKKLQLIINSVTKEQFFKEILTLLNFHEYFETCEKKAEASARVSAFKDLILHSDKTVDSFINELYLNDEKEESRNKVTLMTIHRSKGLEYKVIIIIGVNQGLMPPNNITKESRDEERRLFYVAITRAKELLFVTSAKTHIIYGRKKNLVPSCFLVESGITGEIDKETIPKYWYNR